jgi:glycosyltransferase involved in cell wall biosynthesis
MIMNSNYKLAIVIPAYKIAFFKESMESIANQTCKDFTLYIGDDASPYDFNEIINSYKYKINIIYKRFEKNLGGTDLAAQWNRCIDMIQNEEWIWLFSDDDLMENNCVEFFYKHIHKYKDDSLLHFNIHVINHKNIEIWRTKKFESHYSATEFFSKVINQKVYSCVVEYIFKKEIFEKVNRFEYFDLAWSSDTATWMKLAIYGGISTIDNASVKWRLNTLNISSLSDKSIVTRKANAMVNYLNWAKVFFVKNNLIDSTSRIDKIGWLMRIIVHTSSLNNNEKCQLIIDSLKGLSFDNLKFRALLLWIYMEFKRKVMSAILHKE